MVGNWEAICGAGIENWANLRSIEVSTENSECKVLVMHEGGEERPLTAGSKLFPSFTPS